MTTPWLDTGAAARHLGVVDEIGRPKRATFVKLADRLKIQPRWLGRQRRYHIDDLDAALTTTRRA